MKMIPCGIDGLFKALGALNTVDELTWGMSLVRLLGDSLFDAAVGLPESWLAFDTFLCRPKSFRTLAVVREDHEGTGPGS